MLRITSLTLLLLACAVHGVRAGDVPVFDDYALMRARLGELYGTQKYAEAADLLADHVERFPDHLEANLFNLAVVLTSLGRHDAAVAALKRAVDSGIWFGKYSIQGEYFAPLFELASFQELLARNDVMRAAATPGHMRFEVALPAGYDPARRYPLFLALHGGEGSIEEFSPQWHSPRLTREFVLVYVQSSVASNMQRFSWFAPEEIRADVVDAYQQVREQYAIDETRIYIGGYSAGAIATFWMAYDSPLPVRGYVCLGPPMLRDALTPENIRRAAGRGLRGAWIIGENDPFLPDAREVHASFAAFGHAVQLTVLPNADHNYPADLPGPIDEALRFIMD